ncbi:hypothetical protein K439DRAFT_1625042 [Ramaria rubella]|nr:hypothetical protein K439DRAFT_1625042 [Ramaria rubella]
MFWDFAPLPEKKHGVALYFLTLHQAHVTTAKTTSFSKSLQHPGSPSSILPSLSIQGNLIAGTFTCTVVGMMLNPLAVMKAIMSCVILHTGEHIQVDADTAGVSSFRLPNGVCDIDKCDKLPGTLIAGNGQYQ